MSNLLNEKIKNQAEIFDTALPPFGHFERFEERLERHEQRKSDMPAAGSSLPQPLPHWH